ncbi:hypothetical protein LOK49_LG11G02528 [Camellia lanceoleosa]|uniref:Uncharacterized protein n=1 Tax=Camellia lanceoleosa TaxID=1840588 RepID=A0ACC0G0B8_9ERIC|nr:hypothetical protein LOK49_LG11G02528 [Camellia lanceoleosa]
MVNDKGKGTVSSSNLSTKHDDAADNSQSETTVSNPMKLNVKETGVVSESDDKEETGQIRYGLEFVLGGPSGYSFNSSYRSRDSIEYKLELVNAIGT